MNKNFLRIDKPAGVTSHDVVDMIRKKTGVKKVGHAGTLDPFATGLLILAVGRENTKRIDEFKALSKEYEATAVLGVSSDTGDVTGELTTNNEQLTISQSDILNTLLNPLLESKRRFLRCTQQKKSAEKNYMNLLAQEKL